MKSLNKLLRTAGFTKYSSDAIIRDLKSDVLSSGYSPSKKLWAYRRGFLSSTIDLLGLTEDNYRNYVPDIGYYRMKGLAGHNRYRTWFDNKLTMYYVLQPFRFYLPEYYYASVQGELTVLPCTSDGQLYLQRANPVTVAGVLEKIKASRCVALKKIAGSQGRGFRKIAYNGNDEFLVNDTILNEKELAAGLQQNTDYIITEYIENHECIKEIYPVSLNTLRLFLIRDIHDRQAKIVAAAIRFGTDASGFVDNFSGGGILGGIDIETGGYIDVKRLKHGVLVDSPRHPDTGLPVEGTLPHWDMIKEAVPGICDHFPQLQMFGIDAAITRESFKIIEINMYPSIRYLQLYYPLLKQDPAKSFFNKYLP
jgi:hypothetical protein